MVRSILSLHVQYTYVRGCNGTMESIEGYGDALEHQPALLCDVAKLMVQHLLLYVVMAIIAERNEV